MFNTSAISKNTKAHLVCTATAAALLALMAAPAGAGETAHWGYDVDNGPAHWSALSSDFKTCGTGRQQSPVDIPSASATKPANITFNYSAGAAKAVNNGHTIQINPSAGNSMTIDGKSFKLLQFHFHTPSENTVDGLHYPMEAHLVHKNDAGQLAVVSVLVRAGSKGLIDQLPKPVASGDTAEIASVNAAHLLPQSKSYRLFMGSLTTPPCSEHVTWVVMKQPVEATNASIAKFYSILGANNRPTHPLNGRKLVATH